MNEQSFKTSWEQACDRCDIKDEYDIMGMLWRYYSPRYYHNQNHICYMIDLLHVHGQSVNAFEEIEMAIFFHDAICVPGLDINEHISADLATQCLGRMGMKTPSINRIRKMILMPKIFVSHSDDAKFFHDLDYAILGSGKDKYEKYSIDIESEFMEAAIPREDFNIERIKILEFWLEQIYKDRLFLSQSPMRRMTKQAEKNIAAELERRKDGQD